MGKRLVTVDTFGNRDWFKGMSQSMIIFLKLIRAATARCMRGKHLCREDKLTRIVEDVVPQGRAYPTTK